MTWTRLGGFSLYFATDPFDASKLYRVSSGAFQRSVDGGATWQDFSTGLAPGSSYGVYVDPQVPGVLYTFSAGSGLYKKTGDGPWTTVSNGLPADAFSYLAIDPRNSSTLYVGGDSAIYKSVNGGAQWTATGTTLSDYYPNDIAVDPFDSNHLLVTSVLGLIESRDAGASWKSIYPSSTTAVVFDRLKQNVIYRTGSGATERSADGGATWSKLASGMPSASADQLSLSADGLTVYMGGRQGGVWTYTFGRARTVRR